MKATDAVFPLVSDHQRIPDSGGITVRDYIAIKAIQGL